MSVDVSPVNYSILISHMIDNSVWIYEPLIEYGPILFLFFRQLLDREIEEKKENRKKNKKKNM